MTWFLSEDIYTDNTESYAWVEDAWTDEDIQKIIDLGLSLEEQPGTVNAEAENVAHACRSSRLGAVRRNNTCLVLVTLVTIQYW